MLTQQSEPPNGAVLEGFVVLEGLDGAGTTTQSRLLTERLRKDGRRVLLTSEPTGSPVGRLLRRVMRGEQHLEPMTVAYLFAADRCEHLDSPRGVRAGLSAGRTVVCDRYKYSSLAYQSVSADPDLVARLNEPFPEPEIVCFVDLPEEVGEQRLERRQQREIYEHLEYQRNVRANYLHVLREAARATRVVTIDGTLPVADIAQKIWEALAGTSILKA